LIFRTGQTLRVPSAWRVRPGRTRSLLRGAGDARHRAGRRERARLSPGGGVRAGFAIRARRRAFFPVRGRARGARHARPFISRAFRVARRSRRARHARRLFRAVLERAFRARGARRRLRARREEPDGARDARPRAFAGGGSGEARRALR
jgi:hypothetical protein